MAEESTPGAEAPAAAPPVNQHALHKGSRWEVYFPRHLHEDRDALYIASFPPIIYFWPAILTFLMCGFLSIPSDNVNPEAQSVLYNVNMFDISDGTLGWIAMLVFAFNVLVIVQDFDQKRFMIMVLLLVVFGLVAWLVRKYNLTILDTIVNWLIGLAPSFSTSAYFLFALILLGLFLWGITLPLFDYWKFEHNEFIHYIQPFGRDMSVPRTGSTVSKHIPDMLEFILTWGGGSLVIKREGQVWATIPHIPFLGLRMKALKKMLSETRVTTLKK